MSVCVCDVAVMFSLEIVSCKKLYELSLEREGERESCTNEIAWLFCKANGNIEHEMVPTNVIQLLK